MLNTSRLPKKVMIVVTILCCSLASGLASAKNLRLGMGDQIDSDQGAFAKEFKRLVEQYSNNEINVRLYPGGMLGAEPEMVQNTRLGVQNLALVGVTNLAPFSKQMGMLALPYLIADSDDAVNATTGALGDYWNHIAKTKIGVEILGWTYSNFRHLTNSQHEVSSLEDLQGMKIRVPQNPIMLATYEAWGANAIAMSWTETFTALQQQVVDGQDNPYIVNNSMKFYEIQSYLTELHYMYSLQPLVVGVRAFADMSPNERALIRRAGAEASEYALQYQLAQASLAKQHMQNNGVRVTILKDESRWKAIAKQEVWPRFYSSVGGKQEVEKVLSLLAEARESDAQKAAQL